MLSIPNRVIGIVGSFTVLAVVTVTFLAKQAFRDNIAKSLVVEGKKETQLLRVEFEKSLDGLISQFGVLRELAKQDNSEGLKTVLASTVTQNPELLTIELIKISEKGRKHVSYFKKTSERLTDKRFSGREAAKILDQLHELNFQWLSTSTTMKAGKKSYFKNMTPKLRLPVVTASLRLTPKIDGMWIMISIWADHLNKVFTADRDKSFVVIDRTGHIITSSSSRAMKKLTPWRHPVAQKALSTQPRSGMLAFGPKDSKKLGLFTWSKKYALGFITIKNPTDDLRSVQRSVLIAIAAGIIILLLASLIAYGCFQSMGQRVQTYISAITNMSRGLPVHSIIDHPNDELSALSSAICQASDQLTRHTRHQILSAQERHVARLKEAACQQSGAAGDIKTSFTNISAAQFRGSRTGADHWGHCRLDDGRELLYLVDVSGDGAEGVLATTRVVTACQAASATLTNTPRCTPKDFLRQVNQLLCESTGSLVQATCFVCILDPQRYFITYASAGAPFPMLIGMRSDDARFVASKGRYGSCGPLINRGTPMGISAQSVYEDRSIALRDRDKIVLYTKGVLEVAPSDSRNRKRQFYRDISRSAHFAVNHLRDIAAANRALVETDHSLQNDASIIVIEIRGAVVLRLRKAA